jgi:mannose-P-dolichol utilization defect 1
VLVENLDVLEPQCLKLGISKALGLGIVVAGSMVKLPQLIKLITAKSGAGLSISAYILETIGYIITLAYNVRLKFPYSTYGELPFIAVLNLIILTLVLHYAKKDIYALGGIALALAFSYALFTPRLVSYGDLQLLQGLSIPLSLTSKVPQIYTNYRNSSTGQLAAVTIFNYLLGSLARLFTTLTEVNDPYIFWGFALAAGLNAVLAGQMVYYWRAPKRRGKRSLRLPVTPTRSSARQRAMKTPQEGRTPTTPEGGSVVSRADTVGSQPRTPTRKGRGKKKHT